MATVPGGVDERNDGPERVRFGRFELDLRTEELWRNGTALRLQHQPFKVLALLVSRPGELVTREELRREVWPDGTFVDFEQSLNFCIRQIRATLGDHASTPRFVETLPRRGYRFIAPVDTLGAGDDQPVVPEEPARPAPVPPGPRPPVLLLALAVAGALAAAALAPTFLERDPTSPFPQYQRVTFRRGFVSSARFSPGGDLVYAAGWDGQPAALHLLDTATREEQPLPLDAREVLAVTTAGEVLFRQGGVLQRAPLRGGPAKAVLEGVVAADCTRNGNEVAVARRVDGVVRLEFPIGHPLGTAIQPTHLRISPDGSRIAYLEHPVRDDDRGDVVVVDRDGNRSVLSRGWASADGLAWAASGREVWFTAAAVGADSALHAVDLNGTLRTLAPALGRLVLHDVAPDGRALVERNSARLETRVGTVGGPERELSWLDSTVVTDLSPDGSQMLFVEGGESSGPDYASYLRGTDGSRPVRLGPGRPLALAPDGRWAAVVPASTPDELRLLPVGPGEARVLRDPGTFHDFATWLPDGRLLYTTRSRDGVPRTWVRDPDGGAPRAVTAEGSAVFTPTVSPDGRYVVAATPAGARIVAIDGNEPPQPVPGLDFSLPIAWLADGLVVRDRGAVPAVLSLLHRDGTRRPFLALAPEERTGVELVAAVVLSDDGKVYAYSQHRRWSDLYVVSGLS